MIRHEQFVRDEILPSWFVNRVQDRIAALSRFRLTRQDATTVKVAAGANDEAAVLNVAGLWRFVEANVTRSHPGGAAGTYLIFATAKNQAVDNVPDPNTDHSDYAFALSIVPNATTPPVVAGTVDVFRRIGRCEWDGAAITRVWQEVGAEAELDTLPTVPIAGELGYGGTTDPAGGLFVLADGRLIDRTVHAEYFARVGHAYNGGVDPGGNMVRIQDKRGRASIGADNMGTAQGAANRIPNSNRARGQNGGAERVGLATTHMPAHAHGGSTGGGTSGYDVEGHGHGAGLGAGFVYWTGAAHNIPTGAAASEMTLDEAATTGGVTNPHRHTLPGLPINPEGSGTPHENLSPYEVDNVIVRVA